MKQEKKFRIFSNCIPVKGSKRSTICDLQRNDIRLIPNDLAEILLEHDGKTIKEIKMIYKNKFDSIIDEYFEFLIKNEYVFFTEYPQLFPKMNLIWDDPGDITNAILDRNNKSNYDTIDVIEQLSNLNCKHIELRFFDKVKLKEVLSILNYINEIESTIMSVDLLLPYDKSLNNLNNILAKYNRIASFKIYNSPKNDYIPPVKGSMGYIIYSIQKIKNNTCCGLISKDFFVVNIFQFTESINYNSCLNRKIGIDVNGDIKNCPSMKKKFGNVNHISLNQAISDKEYNRLWSIKKDEVNTCRDCEFRHVCTDCRAFLEKPNDIFSKPLKCGYNPYTNKWQDWASNPLKNKAKKYYDM